MQSSVWRLLEHMLDAPDVFLLVVVGEQVLAYVLSGWVANSGPVLSLQEVRTDPTTRLGSPGPAVGA